MTIESVRADGPASSPSPSPSPSGVSSRCAQPSRKAAVDGRAVAADYPMLAREQGQTGLSVIRVGLSADGSVTSATIDRSAGFPLLDESALASARKTRYVPQLVDCSPVSGYYLFTVQFSNRHV